MPSVEMSTEKMTAERMTNPSTQSHERPFFSIITISRNAETLIGPTLQSVTDQQGVAGLVEHWVVDGASTDGTLDVVRQFPHVRYLSEPDKGITDAFNKGMRLATGRYILYLNCDDIFCDDRVLADLYHFAQGYNLPDWIIGRWYVRRLDGRIDLIKPKFPFASWNLFLGPRICHQGVLLKRDLQEQMGGFDLGFRMAMDYDLWARLAEAGYQITNFDRPLIIYADGGLSARHDEVTGREHEAIKQRLRNTPLKQVAGKLFDQLRGLSQARQVQG
ncbi:MAG: glycosyltransferase [Caldilineaceae bacterium]|nr:glycosyltransferase [Caldilineaceae bacterium]